ncbi:MAG: UbiA family prenyltransferase [Gammaproteobacteria bacterium]|nr:UbiA family prenyltransferase [Gammaproteobacteria bacterium]
MENKWLAQIISWLQLIRLPAGFSVVSNILVAHTLATQGEIHWQTLALTLFASLCLYYGGMVLNDCFDYSEDCRLRPQRPLPAQHIELRTAWVSGYLLLALGCLSSALIHQRAFIIACVLALLIVIYDSNRLPVWLRAINMGLCRYVNWIMGLAIMPLSVSSMILPIPVLCYVVALTRLSQVETTQAPRTRVNEVITLLVLSLLILLSMVNMTVLTVIVLLVLAGYYLRLMLTLIKPHTPEQVQYTVGKLVLGLIPLDAAIGFVFGYWGLSCIVLLLIPLPTLIARKLYIS